MKKYTLFFIALWYSSFVFSVKHFDIKYFVVTLLQEWKHKKNIVPYNSPCRFVATKHTCLRYGQFRHMQQELEKRKKEEKFWK